MLSYILREYRKKYEDNQQPAVLLFLFVLKYLTCFLIFNRNAYVCDCSQCVWTVWVVIAPSFRLEGYEESKTYRSSKD